jgi:hypothetical protein
MQFPQFIGGSYESQALTADCERTINLYVEYLEAEGATSKRALYPTPGVEEITSHTTAPGRAHFFMNSREFAVIGIKLIEIDIHGTVTERGTVALGGNPATISSNGDGGDELFITSGSNGYIFTLSTNVLTQVAALNGKATMGAHLDGYFLALDSATSTLYCSNLLDGTTWDTGTDFAQRSGQPDPWNALIVAAPYIWLFGEQTTELWYNTGAAFPFAPHPSGRLPYGCAAAFSPAVSGQDVLWLGTTKEGGERVYRASGFTPESVTTQALETALGDYTVVSDAVSDMYSEDGHTFYMLHFPTQNITHCYDSKTRLWHERGTWIPNENGFNVWRPRWHVYAYGEHRMLDAETGAIYRMSTSLATDVDGRAIRRLRRAPAPQKENNLIIYPGFQVDIEPGLGTTSGQGADPVVMGRWSNDGGKTWGTERMRSIGKTGEFSKRVRWDRTGSGRRRVFEVSITDPVPCRITDAYLTPDPVVCEGAA